jgi:hypothetical protein
MSKQATNGDDGAALPPLLARLRAKAERALGGLAKITAIQEAGHDGCLWVIRADNGKGERTWNIRLCAR